MSGVSIGEKAPSFRLPSGQGPEVSLEQQLERGPVIVWFTKGMACPFCRQQMSQLARAYPRIRQLGAELLEITPSTPQRARFYAKQFDLPFPYLCDPDHRVRRSWLLDVRSHSVGWYVKQFFAGAKSPPPPNDFSQEQPSLREIPMLLIDEDMGFFIVDSNGIVRYAMAGSYGAENGLRPIPGNDEILRELERCV